MTGRGRLSPNPALRPKAQWTNLECLPPPPRIWAEANRTATPLSGKPGGVRTPPTTPSTPPVAYTADLTREINRAFNAVFDGRPSFTAPLQARLRVASSVTSPPPAGLSAKTVKAIRASALPEGAKAKLIDIFARSAEAKPDFDAKLTAIADEFLGGADLRKEGGNTLLAPLKGADRTIAKVVNDYGGDPAQMKDILRATLIVSNLQQARAVVDAIKARFETTGRDRDLLRKDADTSASGGYRDAKFNIAINGIVAEVQVNVTELMVAKSKTGGGHKLDEEIEALRRKVTSENRDPSAAERAEIEGKTAQMRRIYDNAWGRFLARAAATSDRNSASETPVPLRSAESQGNRRGGSESQAAQNGTPGTSPTETGTPSTSSNLTPGGNVAGTSTTGTPQQNECPKKERTQRQPACSLRLTVGGLQRTGPHWICRIFAVRPAISTTRND